MADGKAAKTTAIQESLLNGGDLHPLSFFDTRKYIQHNLLLADGVDAIFGFIDQLPSERTSAVVRRAFEDGDLSFAHADYELGDWGRMTGFEVHRWEDGRIVEHWDNLQPTPVTLNGSGRGMTDGPADPGDPAHTDATKALVEAFTREVLIARDPSAADRFLRDGALIQHNPALEDGVTSLRTAVASGAFRYAQLRRVIGQGDFALAMSEGQVADGAGAPRPAAFYDLYRVQDGAIAEHWDVVEALPPREQWRNANGKF